MPRAIARPDLNDLLDALLKRRRDSSTWKFDEIIHLAHGPSDPNMLARARRDPQARECMVGLAEAGYYAYGSDTEITKFIRSDRIGTLWGKIQSGLYSLTPEEVLYSVSAPYDSMTPKRLLVVFSSMPPDMNSVNLTRYFTQNFGTVGKYIPPDTAILRVGDLGGVVGSFYMNTTHRPDNTGAIQKLIRNVSHELGMERDSVLLYGVSKGGTGALFHGLLGGYRFISVDPVVSDRHYEERRGDFHFTKGNVFRQSKEAAFTELIRTLEPDATQHKGGCGSAVICSAKSPQFPYISAGVIDKLADRICIFNSLDPRIEKHRDVSVNTVHIVTMLMNLLFYKLELQPGVKVLH